MRTVMMTKSCLNHTSQRPRIIAAILHHVSNKENFRLEFVRCDINDIPENFISIIFAPVMKEYGAQAILNTLREVIRNGAADPRLTEEIFAYLDHTPDPAVRIMPHILQFTLSPACLQKFTDCLAETGADANTLFEHMLDAYCTARRAEQCAVKN